MKLKKLLALSGLMAASFSYAQTNVVSTQMRPVEEAAKVRTIILKGAPDEVNFIPEDGNTYFTRMRAELGAAQGKVHATIALDGELAPVNQIDGLSDLDGLLKTLSATREFAASPVALGKLGGKSQRFIPLMTNTFQMAANKKALQYLPKGANINALTYDQLTAWGKAMKEATGESKIGFPAGPRGLMHRYFQASFYPSHTGGIVRTFKNADAEKGWASLRDLWTYVNPRSTSYGFMEEPLKNGEVWVAFDHTARLLPALVEKPNDFVVFPAPAGAKGRGYMPVMVGMAIPKNTPDRAAAERVIDHMTKPATQALLLKEIGFFPVVKSNLGELSPGIQMASQGMAAVFAAKDGVASLLPVQLGARGGEFNKVYVDTFTRIVLRKEDIKTVLQSQGKLLNDLVQDVGAPCWAPDVTTNGRPCFVD
jgi:multiple sugar transport system substrate-binding protein